MLRHVSNACKTYLIMMCKTTSLGFVVLVTYIDDILLTISDEASISITKASLQNTLCDMQLANTMIFP